MIIYMSIKVSHSTLDIFKLQMWWTWQIPRDFGPHSITFSGFSSTLPTYAILWWDALHTALPLVRTWPELLADSVGHLDGDVLGQVLHAAVAVFQCLLSGASTELYPEHTTLVLYDKSKVILSNPRHITLLLLWGLPFV